MDRLKIIPGIFYHLAVWLFFSLLVFFTVFFSKSGLYAIKITAVLIIPSPVPVYLHLIVYRHFFKRNKRVPYILLTAAVLGASGLLIEVFFRIFFPEPDSHISGIFMALFLICFSMAIYIVAGSLKGTRPAEKENAAPDERSDIGSFLFIRDGSLNRRVAVSDILLCRSSGNYVDIVTGNGSLRTRGPIKKIEARLPDTTFMRVHRSFIVNLEKIDYFRDGFARLEGQLVPVGRTYSRGFSEWLKDKSIGSL